jgi:serine/threonine protein kinase
MANLGKYRLLRKLATGGMAEVFLARAQGAMGFQKTVVIKLILPHFSDNPSFIGMFLEEARLAAELNHPNLVQVFDFGQEDGRLFLAMEYINGPNLRTLNQAARSMEGPIAFPLVARLTSLAAEGLHHAHELRDDEGKPRELVHRDISPDNILVSMNGAVKVVDFGIAKATNQSFRTRTGALKGKLAYMPPEQLRRDPLDRRTDIYALGVVLFELVAGTLPYDATSEVSVIRAVMDDQPFEPCRVLRPDTPPALEAIISCCLEKDRERRYSTCRELQGELDRYIQSTGEVVGTNEISALLARVLDNTDVPTQESKVPISDPQMTPPVAPAVAGTTSAAVKLGESSTGLSNTALRSISGEELAALSAGSAAAAKPTVANAPARTARGGSWGLILGAVGLMAALAVGAGAGLARLAGPGAAATAPPTEVASSAPVVDAGETRRDAGEGATHAAAASGPALTQAVAPALDSGTEPEESSPDAGSRPGDPPLVVVVVDAGTPAAAPGRNASPSGPARTSARLELRIRPYATVSIDGDLIGDTPLPAQALTPGRHSVRLQNASLGKDVTIDVVLKPGENVFKHNLKQE